MGEMTYPSSHTTGGCGINEAHSDEDHKPDPLSHTTRRARAVGCPTCDKDPEYKKLMPPHDASARCESGRREHCSCSVCF